MILIDNGYNADP